MMLRVLEDKICGDPGKIVKLQKSRGQKLAPHGKENATANCGYASHLRSAV
jgi:hypothetical protein